jgi:hypothetical protein
VKDRDEGRDEGWGGTRDGTGRGTGRDEGRGGTGRWGGRRAKGRLFFVLGGRMVKHKKLWLKPLDFC